MKNDNLPLQMLKKSDYVTLPATDPLVHYYLPILGSMYRGRVEMTLQRCVGGERILEVGYGSGITFLNLAKSYSKIYGIDLYADAEAVRDMWAAQGIDTDLRQGNLLELPYADNFFDTVLLISILEHLKPNELARAMEEIHRVLKPGGQMVYGVPVERPLMVFVFRLMGYNIREHHFSTELDVAQAAQAQFTQKELLRMKSIVPFTGFVYQVGHFVK